MTLYGYLLYLFNVLFRHLLKSSLIFNFCDCNISKKIIIYHLVTIYLLTCLMNEKVYAFHLYAIHLAAVFGYNSVPL